MHPLPPGRLLLAFSGGPDSVGLAVRLREAEPLLGYVDHRMRGRRASREERAGVRRIARRIGLRLVRARASVDGGSEGAARRQRYRLLHALARRHGCSAVATAHTADDRAETILFNLLRGSGLRGLAAPVPRAVIDGVLRVRPALDERRDDLRAAASDLRALGDRTNRCTSFARPRTRTLLLPALEADLGEDPVPLLCRLGDTALALRGELEGRARRLAPGADRTTLIEECDAAFPYLVEALRGPGAPLTGNAYRGLRQFLNAGRTGRAYTTPGGETWLLEGKDSVRVSFP